MGSVLASGDTVCTEIEHGKPDLIVVLHGSGAVAWHGVQRLWPPRAWPLCRP